jgi:hypothetical protein
MLERIYWHGELCATCIEEIESLINLQLLTLGVRLGHRLSNLCSFTSLQVVCLVGFDGVRYYLD